MKNEINVDKYGFILYDTERERQHGKLYSHMHYGNEKTLEDVIISLHYAHKGLLKDIAKHKELVKKFQSMNIVEAYAYTISQTYGFMRDFERTVGLISIVGEMPNSIIVNNEAIKELLLNLPQQNKFLIAHVGNLIKEKRQQIKKREDSEKELNKKVFEDYDKLKEEFKF